jgi:hypothetical protein
VQKEKSINPRITLVAAVDSNGLKYASMFQGNSCTTTTQIMLFELASALDKEDARWRENTILLMDGAAYHKNQTIF